MIKRILAINFGGLGDEILFLPTLISLKKDYHMYLLLKHLNPNIDFKHKETKIWSNNPIANLFFDRYLIFNFDSFKIEEKVILENHFKNKKRLY